MRSLLFVVLLFSITRVGSAQNQPPSSRSQAEGETLVVKQERMGKVQPPPVPAGLGEYVQARFGKGYALPADFPDGVLFTSDFDNDGSEDAAIVVRANPSEALAGRFEHNYKVIDPHSSYFGFGDPKITSQFNMEGDRTFLLLIVHGSGSEGWKSPVPKAKFVAINVPFDRMGLTRFGWKKKTLTALSVKESQMMSSVVFWDGKKWRWEPNGMMD